MAKHGLFLLAGLVTLGCVDEPPIAPSLRAEGYANAAEAAGRTYEVTITNLTAGQPLSPGVVVTHTRQASLFTRGSAASEGIRLIAETGSPSTALGELTGAAGVHEVVNTGAPIHRQGGPGPSSLSLTVEASANANRLSLAVMLICTNDGFAGIGSVKLPGGFEPSTVYATAYDAGTEVNDEQSTSIVDPCGGIGPVALPADGDSRTAEGGVVGMHAGIAGGASLDAALHGWTEPVARVTIRRIK
jgi:hypothetical protein